MDQQIDGVLDFTGERMVPERAGPGTFWEHIYRYRFASRFVSGKRVLDIACGEGYGTAALLQAGAAAVIGIDLSEEVCAHARKKYGIDARPGLAERIPLPDKSVDVVVSFETIEHIDRPDIFLDECARVLAPGGRLIISTPNKEVYGEVVTENPFHCSELSAEEFHGLLMPRFAGIELYSQMPASAAWWSWRSLAARRSAWFCIKGSERLRDMLRRVFCPHIRGEVAAKHRLAPIPLILKGDNCLSALLNPYCVVAWARWSREQPMYVIAVVHG